MGGGFSSILVKAKENRGMHKLTDVAVHWHPTKFPEQRGTPLESKAPAHPFKSQL